MAQPVAFETVQAAPMIETVQAAPMVEYVQAAPVVQEVVIPRAAVPRNLLAMGNVVSERVITIEELAAMDRYAAAEAVMVTAPVERVVQPAVEYVQPAPVTYVQ